MKPPFGPIIAQIGPFEIRWYGVLILTGVFLGAVYAARRAEQKGLSPDHIWNGLTVCVILGIIGARLYHVFSTPAGCGPNVPRCGWPWYRQHPGDIPQIWLGGLGIYGAIFGGVLGIVIYARYHGISILSLLDLGAPGLALGQAIGRWGNFFNQELYGPPTGSDWFGVRIEGQGDTLFHPTFLYESLWTLALFIILAVLDKKLEKRLRKGDIFAGYAIGYGVGRFWIEGFFRPDAWMMGPLAAAQWFALLLIVGGGLFVLIRHRGPAPVEQTPEQEEDECGQS